MELKIEEDGRRLLVRRNGRMWRRRAPETSRFHGKLGADRLRLPAKPAYPAAFVPEQLQSTPQPPHLQCNQNTSVNGRPRYLQLDVFH
jgi:hypothetical protein